MSTYILLGFSFSFMNYSVPCGIPGRRLLPRSVSNRVVGGTNSRPGNDHKLRDIIDTFSYKVLIYLFNIFIVSIVYRRVSMANIATTRHRPDG